MKRRLIALVLVVSLVASMCTTAFAGYYQGVEEGEKSDVKYVSLGDSMTNGYGLPGYDGNTGVEDYGTGSYANQFATWLGAEHAQLAMSAMRAEDLHWLLEFDYTDDEAVAITDGEWDEAAWNAKFTTGDYWTWNELCDDYRFAVAAYAIENNGAFGKIKTGEAAIVAEYYQESVKNADVISLGMGNGNFGVFMFGRLLEAIGFSGEPQDAMIYNVERAIAECEPEMQEKILELKAELYATVEEKIGMAVEANPTLDALANTVVYTSLSYVLNYAGSIEAILKLNPDAEIILVALMNTYKGDEEVEGITIGDLLDAVFTPLNAYIAALPTFMQATENSVYADATFYYAEAEHVECLVDEYGKDFDDPNSIIRNRFVQSIVIDENGKPGMVWGLLGGAELVPGVTLTNVTLADIVAYDAMDDVEKVAYAAANTQKAVSIAVYLAFEDAIVASKDAPVTVDSVLGLGGLGMDMFEAVIAEFLENANNCTEEQLNAVAAVVAAQSGVLTAEQALALIKGGDAAIYAFVAASETLDVATVEYLYTNKANADIVASVDALKAAVAAAEMPCMLLGLPANLSAALQNDETVSGLLALFARCVIGNGLGGHPSQGGHNALYEAVVEAYEGEYTASDETKENLIAAAEALAALVAEYYDEAYAYAYAEAKAAGYIDAAVDGIDAAIVALKGIDVSETEMTDAFKAELAGEVEEVIETLAAAKALINEADALDQASMNALMAMLDEAGEAIENIKNLLKQAGVDVNDLVIVPALEKAYDELTYVVIPALKDAAKEIAAEAYDYLVALAEQAGEDLAEAYNAFVEAFLEFLPKADAWLYDWFYNNPDKVIAFFDENGEFFVENAEVAMAVLGYIAYTFGPDVLEWVMENPDKVLEQFVGWYEQYGERTWAMILVYLEELGVIDAAEDLYGCIEDALADLYEQLEDCTDEAYAQMLKQIEALRAELEALRAEIEATANEQLMKLFAQIEKQLDMLEAMIKGEIEATVEEIKAQIAALEKALDELVKAVIAEAEAAVQAAILAAIEAVKTQLSYIEDAAEWLEDAIAEAYEAFIDALIEALPYIDEALYDFFYNNPDKVIAFFKENGEFFAENAEAILAVLGYIAYTFGPDVLEWVMENPDEALEQFIAWYEQYGERTWAMILVYLNELGVLETLPTEEDIKAAIEAIEKQIEDCYKQLENATGEALEELEATLEELKAAVEELKAMVEDYAQMLEAAVRAEIEAAIEKLENAVAELETAVEELKAAVEAQIEEAIAKAEAAVQEAIAKVEAAVNDVIAAIEQDYLDAITGEYTISKDSYYVAIGDETVLAEPSYADMLAETLEIDYTKIGEEGLTVAGTEAVLMENIAEIVKADLITLGYSNNTMISFMIDQATSLRPEELDWSVYGYDELGEYVDTALAEITEELYAQGLDAQTAGLMVTAIESYAYAYTGYMVGYPMVVEAIHEINPDALVIMVGMNNALTDVTLEAEGVELELGEYVQYLVDAANIEALAYAMLTGNAIYVDAPEVETLLEEYEIELGTDMITVLQLLAFPQNRALLNPSEAGYDYIKEQILNALELKYDYLLGDVNLDGRVNSGDTNLLYRFVMKRLPDGFTTLQMWAADVNEDGKVNSGDTNLLYRYVMKRIPALGAQGQ